VVVGWGWDSWATPFNRWGACSASGMRHAPVDVDFGFTARGIDVDIRLAYLFSTWARRWRRGWLANCYDPYDKYRLVYV
jgi:hypothetical protein